MDAILELPMSRVLENLPVDQETKSVLLGGEGKMRPLYQLMLAREAGDWCKAGDLARQLGLSDVAVADAYWQALRWAQQVSTA